MPDFDVKYVFGRLNLIATFTDKKKYFLKGLTKSEFVQKRNFYWDFYDVSIVSVGDLEFIHGFLVKYHPNKDEEVVDPREHKFKDQNVPNIVIGKARFFLHINSGIIAYHPASSAISDSQFCSIFAELFEKSHENFFVNIEIQSIQEEFEIFTAIKEFDCISRIKIYLHPSNPSNREFWKHVDKRLKKLKADSYNEDIYSSKNSGGLEIEEDNEIISKIAMASDGYGKADIIGRFRNEDKVVSTGDNPISVDAPSDEHKAVTVLERLIKTFMKLLKGIVDED